MNNRQIANVILNSDRYHGGYLYGGTTVHLEVGGYWRTPHRFEQRVHDKNHDARPAQGLVAYNKRLLSALPTGSTVILRTRLCGYEGLVEFTKTGPCRWEKVDSWEDFFQE